MSIKRILILLAAMLTFFAVIGAMAAGLIDYNFPELKREAPKTEGVTMEKLMEEHEKLLEKYFELFEHQMFLHKKENNRLDI